MGRIDELGRQNAQARKDLVEVNKKLADREEKLGHARRELTKRDAEILDLKEEIENTRTELTDQDIKLRDLRAAKVEGEDALREASTRGDQLSLLLTQTQNELKNSHAHTNMREELLQARESKVRELSEGLNKEQTLVKPLIAADEKRKTKARNKKRTQREDAKKHKQVD